MLVLFDIDGTLVHTRGAGRRSMEAAAAALLGRPVSLEGIDFAGQLDPVIWRRLCGVLGVADGEVRHAGFRAAYVEHFLAHLPAGGAGAAWALPGIARLLDALESGPDVVLGLLTGNYAETGRAKIAAAGLRDERFAVAAWGDDAGARPDLLPVAVERCRQLTGRSFGPGQVVVVGDTPHDVGVAAAHGCRSLALATGSFSRDALAAAGATRAVDSAEDTADLAAWLRGR